MTAAAALAPEGLEPEAALEPAVRHAVCGRIVTTRASAGPLLTRLAISTDAGEHLVYDLPSTPGMTGPSRAESPFRYDDLADQRVGTATAITGAGGRGWYHPLPWPAVMVAELATRAATAPVLHDAPTFTALGALLARLHARPVPDASAVEPGALPLDRVLSAEEYLTPGQYAWVRSLPTPDEGHAVPVHGQPALGHLFAPAIDGDATPRVVLTWWTPGAAGCPGLDLGHLLGDLLELAMLLAPARPDTARLLHTRAGDVRRGYVAHRTPGYGFWPRVRTGAVLKVLDHRARLARLLGPQAPQLAATDAIARELAVAALPLFRADERTRS